MTAVLRAGSILGLTATALMTTPGLRTASAGETRVNMNVRPDVELNAKLDVSEVALALQYDVQNRSDKVIYVFDRLTSFDAGKTKVEPDQAFVLLEGADAVRVICALMPTPSLKSVARRPPVYVSVVPPRGRRAGRLQLALPLVERHPFYALISKDDGQISVVQRVVFELGWVEQRPGMELLEQQSALGHEIQLTGGWGKPVQWISEIGIPAPGLRIVKHPDPFERSRPLK
jgi:hypothetical protein